jgi:hypothetical protein
MHEAIGQSAPAETLGCFRSVPPDRPFKRREDLDDHHAGSTVLARTGQHTTRGGRGIGLPLLIDCRGATSKDPRPPVEHPRSTIIFQRSITMSPCGFEQQISILPSAGASIGAGT